MAELTTDQIAEIKQLLGEGMSPRAVADSIGRIADLGRLDVLDIRSIVERLSYQQDSRRADT